MCSASTFWSATEAIHNFSQAELRKLGVIIEMPVDSFNRCRLAVTTGGFTHPANYLAGTMQLYAPFPLTPALSLGERVHRRPIRIGITIWYVRPRAGRRSKSAVAATLCHRTPQS